MKTKQGNPFVEGQEARRRRLSKKSNPYGTASREWARWNCGWDTQVKTIQAETVQVEQQKEAVHA